MVALGLEAGSFKSRLVIRLRAGDGGVALGELTLVAGQSGFSGKTSGLGPLGARPVEGVEAGALGRYPQS